MNVLVVSPHPDDEAIGCGGAIRAHVECGDTVHVLHLTSGELGVPGEDVRETREHEAGVASQILGTHSVTFWREPDGGLAVTELLTQRLRDFLIGLAPDRIYVTHFADAHTDHAAAAQLVQAAVRLAPGPDVLMYEVWTPLQRYDLLVDIAPFASHKRAAIRSHASQDQRNSFSEAAMALAHFRGILHGPQKLFAECFERMAL